MADTRQPPRRLYPWESPDEVVRVETPEQITVEYRIAPFGVRMVAALYDQMLLTLIVLGLVLVAIFGVVSAGDSLDLETYGPWAVAVMLVAVFLVQVFYFVWFEYRGEGRTPGKRRLGVRTVMADGRGLTFGAVLVRNLARAVDNFALLWIVPALDRRRRRLGDFLGGTLVVRAGTGDAGTGEFRFDPKRSATDPDRRDFHFPAHVVERLYADDLNLVEHLLARLPHIRPVGRRDSLLRQVAERYRDRLELQDQADRIRADPQRFLFELFVLLKARFEREAY